MAVSDSPTAHSKSARRRKRAAHLGPERRRPLVLDAAYELFLENGFEGTSMDAIAAAAGVSKPVVYDCFASKDELFTAMLDREEERILVETGEALATTGDRRRSRGHADPRLSGLPRSGAEVARHLPRRLPRRGRGQRGRRGPDRRAASSTRRSIAAEIAAHWVERYSDLQGEEAEAAAELLGQTIVGLAQVGARTLLSGSGDWTPETLGEKLGRMAWAARAAI